MNVKEIFENLTTEDKIELVSGNGFIFGEILEKFGIRPLKTSDGPHGLRLSDKIGMDGKVVPLPATAFPCAATLASGWNQGNAFKIGKAIAEECRYYSVDVLLGPGANVKRNPLCGRNFEYFSEDPYLSGKMSAAEIRGLKEKNVGACLKHFALNNSENYRYMGNSIADDRTIREIYVRSFEIALKEGLPDFVMCAYNKVNGEHCSQNHRLLTEILRDEIGFKGVVMSDWGAVKDRVEALKAGLDLEMPGQTSHTKRALLKACKSDENAKTSLDESVERILAQIAKYANNKPIECDFDEHVRLCASVAEDCAVLMKNDGILPLSLEKKHLVLGEFFENARYQGAGSSMITPTKLTTVKDAFDTFGVKYTYYKDLDENEDLRKNFDDVVIFIGLPELYETECKDRDDMRLPEKQLSIVKKAIRSGLKTAAVFFGGSPVELPFIGEINAFLNAYLPGQNCGLSTYRLLFGLSNPCGKLAETWVKSYDDVPFGKEFGKSVNQKYKENIHVGYAYYSSADIPVAFPFGFGLSYTSFEYGNLSVEEKNDGFALLFTVKNTGGVYGAEIAQIYISPQTLPSHLPKIRLVGFDKVYLRAGEEKEIAFFVDRKEFAVYSESDGIFRVFGGKYKISVRSDCLSEKLAETVEFQGENYPNEKYISLYGDPLKINSLSDENFSTLFNKEIDAEPPTLPLTVESPLFHFKQTFFGKIIYFAAVSSFERQIKRAEKIKDEIKRDALLKGASFMKFSVERSNMRTAAMTMGKKMPYRVAEGIVAIANGKLFRGIAKIIFGR